MNFETFKTVFEKELNIAFTEQINSGAEIQFSKEEAADSSVYMILDDECEIASDYSDSIYVDEHNFGSRIQDYLTKVDPEGDALLVYIDPEIIEEEHLIDWEGILTARGLNINEDVQNVIELCMDRKFHPALKKNTFVIIDDTNTEVLKYSVSRDDEDSEPCVTGEEHAAILDLIAFELVAGKTFAEGMHQDLHFKWELV